MAADKVHLLLVPDVDLILQDFRLFLCVARQDTFQSPDVLRLLLHSLYPFLACLPLFSAALHFDEGFGIFACRILQM